MTDPLAFLDGGGFMGELMKRHDWSRSPLGAPASWPDTLKTTIATCLSSRFPMVIWWGPQLCMLYNDAWQPILGDTKHPAGLGRPGRDSWPETWPIVGRQFEDALHGAASWSEDLLLASDRQGFMQECYFTYSHSPLRDAFGRIVGVHSVVSETTERVLSERRLRKLRDVGIATVAAAERRDALHAACAELVRILCANNPDAPFALLYVADENAELRCCAADGIHHELLLSDGDPWRIRKARDSGEIQTAALPADLRIGSRPWPEPVQTVVSVPLISERAGSRVVGVLVAGVNSRLRLDQPYLDFLRLVAAQIAGSISALRSMENEARAARVKEVLVLELQHRTRNLLALVRSIADRTLRASASLDDFHAEFSRRLSALSRVQGVLSREEEVPIELEEVLRLELAPLANTARERIILHGPRLVLPRAAVQVLSLGLHELATNAVKHGALSNGAGLLAISWEHKQTDDRAHVCLHWVEQCEREHPAAGTKIGFGRTLIEQAIPHQLGGSTEFSLRHNGLDCRIEIPLA
jgi:two-component sensor histidine kinase